MATLLGAGVATAQDLSGLYVGGHLGSVRNAGDYTAFTPRNGFAGFDLQGLQDSGGAGGVHMGYNWDHGAYIVGVEGSFTAMSLEKTSTSSTLLGSGPLFGQKLDSLATLMPKVGVKSGNAMFYAKAGLALGRIGAFHNQNGTVIEGSNTQTGWAAGIGAEFPVGNKWTGRIDYTYADFGSVRTDMAGSPDIWATQKVTEGLLSVGFNYYFN